MTVITCLILICSLKGLDQYKTDRMEFNFDFYAPSQEKGYQNEAMYTTLYYKYHGGDVESFKSRSKKEIEEVTETTRIQVDCIQSPVLFHHPDCR